MTYSDPLNPNTIDTNQYTTTKHHESLLNDERIRIFVGRSINGKLEKVWPVERENAACHSGRHTITKCRQEKWNCEYLISSAERVSMFCTIR